MDHISLADAKARLSELVDRVGSGASINITRRGKAVARLSAVAVTRKPVDLVALQALTKGAPMQQENAGDMVRSMRDNDRY